MSPLLSRLHLVFTAVFLVTVVPLSVWLTVTWVRADALEGVRDSGERTLNLFLANLESEIEKYAFLPQVLATDREIVDLLRNPAEGVRIDQINAKLTRVNQYANALDTYVMQPDGTTIAASNWNQPHSFVGRNFAFRPYFQAARAGRHGRYFALGTASNIRGYYFSAPVYDNRDDSIIGVTVVKVGLERLEAAWRDSKTVMLVTDANGVVFAANRPRWLFRTLSPLDAERLETLRRSKQYSQQPIAALNVVERYTMDGLPVLEIETEASAPVRRRYLMQTAHLAQAQWDVHALSDLRPLRERTTLALWLLGSLLLTLLLIAFYTISRRTNLRMQHVLREQQEAALREAHDRLEQRVSERTAELQASHDRLRREIAERQRANDELRRAQDELVQAGKLAALGQLAAGITHELNQPLAAIQSYAQNARELLARERSADTLENLDAIAQLTERMARITSHLKTYSRKSSENVSDVALHEVVAHALSLVAAKARQLEVEASTDVDPDFIVRADPSRLEQVVLNLINNALDAMAASARRELCIRAVRDGDLIELSVHDSGTGIAEQHLSRVFDPFFTTKEVGEGLGLGLSISHSIVKGFGGALIAANDPGGGAVFRLRLPGASAAAQVLP